MLKPSAIPGMIEPVEQQTLIELVRNVPLDAGDSIVEFGTFFGRSTACLVNGLLAREDLQAKRPTLYAYDSFVCKKHSFFAGAVRQFAKAGNVEMLLEESGEMLRFQRVFEHFLDAPIKFGLLKQVAGNLEDIVPSSAPIALMHVDAPKTYPEFRHVLVKFFPTLKLGAVIILQDYFYHWSATLIAATQVLLEANCMAIEKSAATSLVVTLCKHPTAENIAAIDSIMQKQTVPECIDTALQTLDRSKIDRPDSYLPRLSLAKIQYLKEHGKHEDAAHHINIFVRDMLSANTKHDLDELERFEYSTNKLFALDV